MFADTPGNETARKLHNITPDFMQFGVLRLTIYIILTCWVSYYTWLFIKEDDTPVIDRNSNTQALIQVQKDQTTASRNISSLSLTHEATTKAKNYASLKYSPSELISLISKRNHENSDFSAHLLSTQDLNKYLNKLVAINSDAIPAIQHYLRSGNDLDFLAAGSSKEVGYGSLRLALFDVLYRIGAPESESVWYEALHNTTNPTEIAALASYLDEYAPDKYRRDIMTTAREAFSLVSDDGILGKDAGPVFQVFQDYGDASLVSDLEQVSQLRWGKYASLTLANLPDGAGIPSLVRMTEGAEQTNLGARFALQMLAQSADHPEAQAALINTVRENQIPDRLWPQYAHAIAGTYKIQIPTPGSSASTSELGSDPIRISSVQKLTSFTPGGGQVIYGVSYQAPLLTTEQMEKRLELIDTLISETSNPTARRVLEQAYTQVWNSYIKKNNP